MTLLDENVSAVPVGPSGPAGRAGLTRASLEALAALADDVADDADQLDGTPLADLMELLADLDAVAGSLAMTRGLIEAQARASRGWARNRWADPDRGIRAERSSTLRKVWDIPRAAGRLAPLLNMNPETGEVDNPLITKNDVDAIIRRFLVFASVSSLRTTALNDAGVEFDDLVEVEERPAKVRVYRETPAAGAR